MTEATFRFETGTATHRGHVRAINEDRLLARPEEGVWLVADGMGGHWGGDYAATSIVEHVGAPGPEARAPVPDPGPEARLAERLGRANAAIRAHAARHDGATIGATVAVLMVQGAEFACFWAGDSRVYLLREGRFAQLSHDHTEVQELLDAGAITPAEARIWPRRNVITRAVGVHEHVRLDRVAGRLRAGDVFLLCSDGLTGHLEDREICVALAGRDPQAACDLLVAQTLERGASDNVTVVAVRCADPAAD